MKTTKVQKVQKQAKASAKASKASTVESAKASTVESSKTGWNRAQLMALFNGLGSRQKLNCLCWHGTSIEDSLVNKTVLAYDSLKKPLEGKKVSLLLCIKGGKENRILRASAQDGSWLLLEEGDILGTSFMAWGNIELFKAHIHKLYIGKDSKDQKQYRNAKLECTLAKTPEEAVKYFGAQSIGKGKHLVREALSK